MKVIYGDIEFGHFTVCNDPYFVALIHSITSVAEVEDQDEAHINAPNDYIIPSICKAEVFFKDADVALAWKEATGEAP